MRGFFRRKAETELNEDESKIQLELQQLKEMIENIEHKADVDQRKSGIKMEEFLPVTYEGLNSFFRRKAETELNEDESNIELEIQQLKEMVKKEGLPCEMSNEFLLWLLRSKKHQLKRAYEQLQKYSCMRHDYMKFFGFVDFHKIKVPIENGVVGLLPYRDAEGRVIIYLRPGTWNSTMCDPDDVVRAIQVLFHFSCEHPASQISGFCFIFDNSQISFETLRYFVKYFLSLGPAISCFPARLQTMAVNTNVILRSLSPILLSVLPSKIRKRTTLYGDARTVLPGNFDPGLLPEEFGGTLGPISTLHHSWIDALQRYVPKFLATNKHYKRKNTVPFPEY